MNVSIEKSWEKLLKYEFKKEYFIKLVDFVKEEYKTHKIYPPGKDIFKAFDYCSVDKVKVIILGQDPYHGKGQAHGLCFSVPEGTAIPPSLVNIYKEIKSDLNKNIPETGNLEHWAKQGVLLLNATLTVRADQAGSHQNKGWENFTDSVIKKLSESRSGLVFLLWGNFAKAKQQLIDQKKHYVLQAAHPSPFSAYNGFFGCKHFSKTNEILKQLGKEEINWSL